MSVFFVKSMHSPKMKKRPGFFPGMAVSSFLFLQFGRLLEMTELLSLGTLDELLDIFGNSFAFSLSLSFCRGG